MTRRSWGVEERGEARHDDPNLPNQVAQDIRYSKASNISSTAVLDDHSSFATLLRHQALSSNNKTRCI